MTFMSLIGVLSLETYGEVSQVLIDYGINIL